jgi:hypothetical protein
MGPEVVEVLATVLIRISIAMVLGFTVLGGVFTAGYALDDPGGAAGVALVASWLVPLLVLSWFAWRAPLRTLPWLVAACLVPLGLAVWSAFDTPGFRDALDEVGPVPAVALIVLGPPIVLLGRVRPLVAAGLAAVVTVLAPVIMVAGGALAEGGRPAVPPSTVVAGFPLLVAGVLMLVAGVLRRREGDLPDGPAAGPPDRPQDQPARGTGLS